MANVAVNNNRLTAAPFAPATPTVSASGFVTVNGVNVIVAGDAAQVHINSIPTTPIIHNPPVPPEPGEDEGPNVGPGMVASQTWVTINGVPAIVDGDNATCGHSITGTGFVDIG